MIAILCPIIRYLFSKKGNFAVSEIPSGHRANSDVGSLSSASPDLAASLSSALCWDTEKSKSSIAVVNPANLVLRIWERDEGLYPSDLIAA